ncbi:MAG: TonB-dependent receptor, partial [Gammaproteobacteria bacterium]
RYAKDSKGLAGGALGTGTLPSAVNLEFDSFTPRVTLRFKPSEDLTLYTLVAKGTKPGEFNTEFFRATIDESAVNAALNGCVPPPPPAQLPIIPCLPEKQAIVKEEEQWTYEVGAKARWLDGRLTTNLAAYYIDWTNQGLFTTVQILQTSGTYLTTTIIRNVGASEVKGLELETSFRVNDRLSLVANYGYTDSRYVEGTDTILGMETDIGGKRVPSVPRNTLILGGVVTVPLTSQADAFLNVDYVYNSRRYTSANNFGWIGDDRTVNLRAGLQAGSWTITGYVRNLLDDDTPVAVLDFVNFGPVDVSYPVDANGNLLNGLDPRMNSINPKRGRDLGLEVQYRF